MAVPALRLQDGEAVLYETIPSAWWSTGLYMFTLGLFHFWRYRHRWVITNQRFIALAGIVSKKERALPLDRIQDVNVKASPLSGGCVTLTTAGGVAGVGRVGPLTQQGARDFADALEGARKGAAFSGQGV